MEFPKTVENLRRLPPSRRNVTGSHLRRREQVGKAGDYAGEVRFDPRIHSTSDINQTSFLGEVLGQQYVRQQYPRRQMRTSVVIDRVGSDDSELVARSKQKLALAIGLSLNDSIRQASDASRLYLHSEVSFDDARLGYRGVEKIASDRDMLEVCAQGLTFVISDFRRYPSGDQTQKTPFIAIKTNHPIDIALPPNCGVLPADNGFGVNTDKAKELQRYNELLADNHHQIVNRLENTGISVATAIYDPIFPAGFDVARVDESLSQATAAYANK